jgi:predicted nucleotide-binding protein (sugar kinase/HSP70/actin superfamily)
MEMVFSDLGYDGLRVLSPSSRDGYMDLGDMVQDFMKLGWFGLVGSDALRKLLHKYRPYETRPGAADEAHEDSLDDFCAVLEDDSIKLKDMPKALASSLARARERFRAVPADWSRDVLLIGVVGEIFCRLSTFSNEDLIRRMEKFSGQAWLSDISEWIWYTDEEHSWWLTIQGKKYSIDMAKNMLKKHLQMQYEKTLLQPLKDEFAGMEEPHGIREVLDRSEAYLPSEGSKGEMVLSVGKAIYLYEKGADAIIDISPFTCMNGIISEAVYPAVSRDHDDIPIRTFYFDGTSTNLENDLEIFMELARNYNRRKKVKRSGA